MLFFPHQTELLPFLLGMCHFKFYYWVHLDEEREIKEGHKERTASSLPLQVHQDMMWIG